jgi:cytochrome c peroxidase
LIKVDDPYGYASANELSLFRRPLPTTNLRFLSTVMHDGRETLIGSDHCNISEEGGVCFESIQFNLAHQSNSAITSHARGISLTPEQREAIVAFEIELATAQFLDKRVGNLSATGGQGGPDNILSELTYYGINDNLGDYETGAPFTSLVFTLYSSWIGSNNTARAAIARGENLFNNRPITISGVGGLNGSVGSPFTPPLPDSFTGSCTTCHNTPNAGNHSIVAPLNIGISDASRRTSDMPLYTFKKMPSGPTIQTTDPGRALISGKFDDIGKFKGPTLRGLAARAPYFHNGAAKDLDAVIDFYDERFQMNLTPEEHKDLVAFLRTL